MGTINHNFHEKTQQQQITSDCDIKDIFPLKILENIFLMGNSHQRGLDEVKKI
jgi:hypothetical protein